MGCCQHLGVTGQPTCLRKKRLQEVTWEPVAGTSLARLQVSSLELGRTERENGDPVREAQRAHLSEARTEMRQLIQHGTSRGDLTHLQCHLPINLSCSGDISPKALGCLGLLARCLGQKGLSSLHGSSHLSVSLRDAERVNRRSNSNPLWATRLGYSFAGSFFASRL